MHCLQHEGELPRVPLHPIVATAPLDLLHVDFTSIEMTMELNQVPRVKEYLLYQPFLVKTDKNPLTYIMMTPNLDATGHHPGVPGSLHKAHYSICDPQSNS